MVLSCRVFFFFFQAEDGIRDAQESRGLGDVYKRQPLMLALLLPAEKARLMDPLIRTASQHQRILLPDTASGKLKSCILERLTEVQPFRIGVPYIDAAVIRKAVIHTLVSGKQEVVEIAVTHVIVHDLSGSLLNIHIVRRIRQDEVCFLSCLLYTSPSPRDS